MPTNKRQDGDCCESLKKLPHLKESTGFKTLGVCVKEGKKKRHKPKVYKQRM